MSRFENATFDTCCVSKLRQLMSQFTIMTLIKCYVSESRHSQKDHFEKWLDCSKNSHTILATVRFWVIFVS